MNRPQIWSFKTSQFNQSIGDCLHMLSEDEKIKAGKYRFNKDMKIYVLARATLRFIISKYLKVDPNEIHFTYSKYQKPSLLKPKTNLHFNVSHSGERVLIGFTEDSVLGVDIELIKYTEELTDVARRFFSDNEVSDFLTLSGEDQSIGFFNCWTRKEAFIKAVGQGLSFPLKEFDVSLLPAKEARLLSTHFNLKEKDKWSLFDIPMDGPYKAALALPKNVSGFDFTEITGLDDIQILS